MIKANETLDGWAVLHNVFQVDWTRWKQRSENERAEAIAEATDFFRSAAKTEKGDSGLISLLGHKGDLMVLHFRPTLDELNDLELRFRQLRIADDLKETDSYVSFIELGLYEMTLKLSTELAAQGIQPDSDAWKEKWRAEMAEQKGRMGGRIYTKIPEGRYVCFYPMDKKRGEKVNWYTLPIEKRQLMMRDHGMIGRKYAGQVTQVITGSIGYDDWEWGVYLFAADPLVFKKLIYEMRYDEASALYAHFGPFVTGLRFAADELPAFFSGRAPLPIGK